MDNLRKVKSPFVIQLIEELKKHECISSGIMLPLLIGAYKVKENYQEENYLKFFKHIYNDVVESLYESEQHLYFRECESSHNFVLEPVNNKPQKSNITISHKGKAVIYCKDATLGNVNDVDAKDMQSYFLNKFIKQAVRYCNFIEIPLGHMRELKEHSCGELDVIKSILTK